jgi:hypothetical protein
MFKSIQNLWNLVFGVESGITWDEAIKISKDLDLNLERLVSKVNKIQFVRNESRVRIQRTLPYPYNPIRL